MQKRWQVKQTVQQEVIERFPELNPVMLQLLVNRDLTTQRDIDVFLDPDYSRDLHDPFLFSQMEQAVKRILTAVENQEKIIVYGDYDADGVTSTAVMFETIKALGAKNLEVYIPFREKEGYGLNMNAVTQLAEDGTKLVVTVDCGITNTAEVEFLMSKGVDVVVTDHHHAPPELPKAHSVINPNVPDEPYPFGGITGCGVAFKVAQGLVARHQDYKIEPLPEGFEKWLLDLVAIGTIADIQPVLDENRVFVKYGLVVLNKTRRIGLQKLIASLRNREKTINEKIVGWQLTPRLNAAGRLNHASTAYQLLVTEDEKEAEDLTTELTQTNQERQKITETIRDQAKGYVGEVKDQKILIAVGEDWPTGMVGLVAGKIADEYHLPCLVISRFNGEIIGSARSITEFNVIEAIEKCGEYMEKFGGHPQAAGFTLKNEEALEGFKEKITELAEGELDGKDLSPVLDIDAEVDLEQVNWELFETLEKLPPYGEANPKPIFLARGLTVIDHKKMGKDETHMRLMVSHTTPVIRKTVGFRLAEWCDKLKKGDKVDMVFEVDINEWNGNRELQLKIVDLRHA